MGGLEILMIPPLYHGQKLKMTLGRTWDIGVAANTLRRKNENAL